MGEELTFAEKIKTLQFATGKAREKRTREFRDDRDGHRVKVTKDEATRRGNLTIEHATKDDRVDVTIRPDLMTQKVDRAEAKEVVAEAKEAARHIKFEGN